MDLAWLVQWKKGVFVTVVSERPVCLNSSLFTKPQPGVEESHKATFRCPLFVYTFVSQPAATSLVFHVVAQRPQRASRSPLPRGNDRYRCHLNCVTHCPPNWTGLAVPYAQDVGVIAPAALRSWLTFSSSTSWGRQLGVPAKEDISSVLTGNVRGY